MATAYSYMADLNIKLNENEKGLQNYFKAMNLMDTLGAKMNTPVYATILRRYT